MASLPPVQTELINDAASSKPPFYCVLWVQVLVAMALAIVLGYVDPVRGVAMKPLGDAFIRLITMIITLIIFCTVVTGIAGMESLKKGWTHRWLGARLLRTCFHGCSPYRTAGGQYGKARQRL